MNKTTTQLRQAKHTSVDTGSIPRSRAGAKPKAQVERKPIVEAINDLFAEYGMSGDIEAPSWKRVAVATLATLTLAFGAGYGIGTLAMYAMVGVMTLTGSTLLSYLVFALALIISMYVGFKIGQHVGNYILSGQIDRDIGAVKNKVVGFFKRGDMVAA